MKSIIAIALALPLLTSCQRYEPAPEPSQSVRQPAPEAP